MSLDDPARDSPLVGQRQSTCFLGHGTRCRTRYFREATRYFQSAASSDTWAPERVLSLPPRPPLTTGNKPFLRGQANNGNGFSFKTIALESPSRCPLVLNHCGDTIAENRGWGRHQLGDMKVQRIVNRGIFSSQEFCFSIIFLYRR